MRKVGSLPHVWRTVSKRVMRHRGDHVGGRARPAIACVYEDADDVDHLHSLRIDFRTPVVYH